MYFSINITIKRNSLTKRHLSKIEIIAEKLAKIDKAHQEQGWPLLSLHVACRRLPLFYCWPPDGL